MTSLNQRLSHAVARAAEMRQFREQTGWAYIYIIRCHDHQLYKIGAATNISQRLTLLQIGCPFELKVIEFAKSLEPYALERELHSTLHKHRVRGEWFRLNDEQLRPAIDTLKAIIQF